VKATLGLVLLLFGVVALVLSLSSVQKTNEILNDSFSLSPNQTSSPYSVSYNSHSQSPFIIQPVLYGEVSTRGENVEFTIVNQEQQTRHQIIQTAVNQEYSFNLPINTPYEFTLQNPSSSQPVSIEFALKATWTDTAVLIPGLIALTATCIP
jgi:CRISPR/Cas system endoribonuclease Cas6 (RAMP superfamily)